MQELHGAVDIAGADDEQHVTGSRATAQRLQRRAQPGDVLLVVGAGDVDRAVELIRG
jgi:UDP-N-acetylmuramate-alanine ligase